MNKRDFQKKIIEKQQQQQMESLDANKNRAQSITIGSSGGGSTEISMRGCTGGYLWNVYQPVEVVELINQLAANIGCHIHIQPREDFASWRKWNPVSDQERLHLNGFPPFSNRIGVEETKIGANLPPPREQPGFMGIERIEEKENDVATKKTVNRRSPKRARSSSK